MPKRIRLGTVTNGSLDSTDATLEIDGDDLYITVENGDVRTDGTVAFEDSAASPSANGEIQRNGSDLEAFSGGAVRSLSNIGSGLWEAVTGAIRPDTADTDVIPNGNGSLGTSSDPWPVVTTEKADITNETYIEAHRETDTSSQTAGTMTNIFDTEDEDVRGEFNSSQQVNPDEAGKYRVSGVVWTDAPSDGDTLRIRVQDVSSGSTVKSVIGQFVAGGSSSFGLPFGATVPLSAGTNYEVQAANLDSSFSLLGGFRFACYGTIERVIVGP